MGFRGGHTGFVAETGIEWESSGRDRKDESLDTGPLDTRALWLYSEPLQVFLNYRSNKK